MEAATHPPLLVDRLRANLAASAIPVSEIEIQEILDRGYLTGVAAFEQLVAAGEVAQQLPDYLGKHTEPEETVPALPEPVPGETGDLPLGYRGPVPGMETWSESASTRPRFASLVETARQVHAGSVSPEELTRQALAAIAEEDPALNAFQAVLEETALAAAQEAERELRAGLYRGPLHGIPVAVKDLCAMVGTPTTAGSSILAGRVTDFDATAVTRLRAAGAVIVGKTRLSEFAYSPGSNNAHYGPTRNPWNRDHDTGGSSSGSAAAVAAGLVYAALGTDTGGSIRIPASLCGLVGLKPTFARCSLYGVVPLSWSLDHMGPLARTVHDAAAMLEVLAGVDPHDPRTGLARAWRYTSSEIETGAAGLRIGVVRDDGSGHALGTDDVLSAWEAGLASLQAAGAELVDIDLPELEALRLTNSAILVLEAASYHQPTLRTHLADYGPFPRHRLLHAFAYGPLALSQAQQLRARLRMQLTELWEDVDLLSTPTMPFAAPELGVPAATTFTCPFNALGWPAISMPVGLTADARPLGLQLIGKPWDELTVLRAARILELAGPWHA